MPVDSSAVGRLVGRKILVTGGGSGIGLAAMELFRREGARVCALDRSFAVPSPECVQADVTSEASVGDAVHRAATAMGGIDGLVNCAGISITEGLDGGKLENWRRVIDVNLVGCFVVTQAVLPFLREASLATVVNVASGIALRPLPGFGAYAASKAGLLAWTKVLAQELAPAIRVNALCPGSTDTPLMRANMPAFMAHSEFVGQYALRRQGTAAEQSQAMLFLTSGESSFMTGATLVVDGGRAYY